MIAGHADRPVREGRWEGRPAVVKTYHRGGADTAWAAMVALWASPFGRGRRAPGLPEPLALEGERLVMERLYGPAVGRRGSLDATLAATDAAAALLAALHGSGVVVPRRRTGARIVRSLQRKLPEIEARPVRTGFAAALEALDPRALDDALVISHGDFSPRNVLLTARGPRLIDLDRVQMAPRSRDVAYWGAWAWATLALSGETPDWDIAHRFETAYTGAAGLPAAAPEHRDAHRAAALLRIAHGWSALRDRPAVAELVTREALDLAAGVLRPMDTCPASGGRRAWNP